MSDLMELAKALEGNSGPLADAARRIAIRLADTDHGQADAYWRAKQDILVALAPKETSDA